MLRGIIEGVKELAKAIPPKDSLPALCALGLTVIALASILGGEANSTEE